jgi:hypothetical protein
MLNEHRALKLIPSARVAYLWGATAAEVNH